MSAFHNDRAILELCVDSADGLMAALAGGADRVELCSALSVGGLTPSSGFMQQAVDLGISAMAMIRPRAGDFVFDKDEADTMLRDIATARETGVTGVVLGASRPDDTLDIDLLKRLKDAAGDMETCLHRAFDLTPDPFAAVDQAAELGFTRILTSGQQKSVPEGLDLLIELGAYAGDRISIMPGGGITLGNVARVIRSIGITEIHSSCSTSEEAAPAKFVQFGFAPPGDRKLVSAEAVAEMRRMLAVIAAPDPVITGEVGSAAQSGRAGK